MPDISMKLKMKILEEDKLGRSKSLDDYLKDPKFRDKLSDSDIKDLIIREENVRIFQRLREALEKELHLPYKIGRILELPIKEYKRLIPYLLPWVSEFTDWRSKEGLIRDLSTPYAKKDAYKFFINEFKKVSDREEHSYKWAIGNGLEVFAGDDIVEELIPLVLQREHGGARQMIVLGLGKIKNSENKKRVTQVLIRLLDDEDVAGHAIEALRKLNAKESKPYIEKFLTHKRTWWRNAAKKAIAKFDKEEKHV